ncbi:hypothetical protein [Ekhidna sp.]
MRVLMLLLLLTTFFSCKNNQAKSSISDVPNQYPTVQNQYPSYDTYIPNPDEVVLQLRFVEAEFSGKTWKNNVKVIRQLKAGFGFKDRLRSESEIVLLSEEKITLDEFYCSAQYQLSENLNEPKTFVLMKILK